jgi:hypothetical protein
MHGALRSLCLGGSIPRASQRWHPRLAVGLCRLYDSAVALPLRAVHLESEPQGRGEREALWTADTASIDASKLGAVYP